MNNQLQTVDNAALVQAGLISVQPTLPVADVVRRGKGHVNVQRFGTTGSAKSIKEALKEANPLLSAKALTVKVNETLRGERDLRSQLAVAWVQGRLSCGDIPDVGEVSAKGSVLRMKSLPEPVVVEAPKPKTADEIKAAIEALQAQLAGIGK